ncbi:Nucleolar protein 16, partial [Tulasnella sp. 427]
MPSVKGIAGATAIRAAWDKKKSVRQNYAALGLATGGTPVSGKGAKLWPSEAGAIGAHREEGAVASPSKSNDIPKGYARIVRDEQGNVVRIEEAEDDVAPLAEDGAPAWAIQKLDIFEDDDKAAATAQSAEEAPKTDVVRALEERATKWKQAKVPQSENEVKWLMSLVKAHGDDIEAMHMDIKLNVWQRTPGELRRA